MRSPLKLGFIMLSSLALIFLAACGSGEQAINSPGTAPNTATETVTNPNAAPPSAAPATENAHPSQGGQVIETGPYHLELVALPETGGTHLDFYLQKGDTHEAIPNANVTAQIQMPNGEQKILDMEYDEAGKHYAAFLPAEASGEYKVAILTDINGEKVNGRFTFTQ